MRKSRLWTALFLVPPLILFAVVVAYPAVSALRLSFTDANLLGGAVNWVGWDNFADALGDKNVRHSIRITLIWTVAGAVFPPAIGLALAHLLQSSSRFSIVMKSALFTPLAVSLVVVGQVWIWIYQPDGLANTVLGGMGLEGWQQAWLANRSTALWAVFIAWSWQQIVLALILYLAGLSSVPAELAEAARVDGGNRWQVFRKVTFPLLAPVTTVVLSLVSINSLRNFDLVFAMTEGGPVRETETLPLLVFRVLLRELQQGEAAAIALLLFLITLAVVGMFTWWGRSKSRVL